MALRILHTADWHLGQKFYDYDRTEEHRHFLEWLINIIQEKEIDVLLVAGDIFDVTNPTSAAQKLFYNFLYEATSLVEGLQIILIAGNHDSAARLEAPSALMDVFNVSVVGLINQTVENEIDYDPLIIPLRKRSVQADIKKQNDEICAYCLAVPYLRMGDFPIDRTQDNPYTAGVHSFYRNFYQYANDKNEKDLPLIAMGHLHTREAMTSDSERGIRGGLEMIETNAFDEKLSYVALGHIHKAQCVGNKEYIRYSGSPIPMSFSEVNYRHQVVLVDILSDKSVQIEEITVPRHTDLIRIGTPVNPLAKEEILIRLQELPLSESAVGEPPYLEINVLLDGPDLMINQEIKEIVATKHVRLARNVAFYKKNQQTDQFDITNIEDFKEISPLEMLSKYYQSKYATDLPKELEELFNQVVTEIQEKIS